MHGVAVAGHVKFEIDVIKLYQETGQNYHVVLLKQTTRGNQKLIYDATSGIALQKRYAKIHRP